MHDLQTIVALNARAIIKEPNSFCKAKKQAKAEWLKENKMKFLIAKFLSIKNS